MNSKLPRVAQVVTLIFIGAVMLEPMLSNGQVGIGGTVVHRPRLGCACIATTESEVKDAQKSPRSSVKMSEQECRKKGDVTIVYGGTEVDKRAVILDRPEPEMLMSAPMDHPARVILKAVLCPNRSIGRIGVVIGASDELNQTAIKAARKIKFDPAMKAGRKVAQYIQLEYEFDAPQ